MPGEDGNHDPRERLLHLASRVGAVRLRDIEVVDGDPMLLPPLISAQGVTVWFGDGGAFKSTLALHSVLTLANESTTTGPIVWVDFEGQRQATASRAKALIGSSLIGLDVFYVPGRAPIEEMRDLLVYVQELQPALVVIDSAARAVEGDTLEPKPVARFYDFVARFPCPSLVIAHVTKNDQGEKPFGSNSWNDGARLTWAIDRPHGTTDVARLRMRKSNYTDLLRTPLHFRVTYSEGSLDVATVGDVGPEGQRPRTSRGLRDLVESLSSVAAAPISARQIQEAGGFQRSTLHDLLKATIQDGLLRTTGRGKNVRYEVADEPNRHSSRSARTNGRTQSDA
jgi:hypothetical protein